MSGDVVGRTNEREAKQHGRGRASRLPVDLIDMGLIITPPAANWKQVRTRYQALPVEIREYLGEYPQLLEKFSWKVTVGYVFTQLETAHRTALYCGSVKRHRVDSGLAWHAIDLWDMKRKEFSQVFKAIFDHEIGEDLTKLLREAEEVRDKNMHGKTVQDADQRRCQVRVLDYLEGFHDLVRSTGVASPFDDLRGFKGAAQPLEANTSRLVLKGLGFPL
jgi:hypothetical protein